MREETEKKTGAMKMVLAVLQGDDYADTVDELNRDGFSATILSSTGGFLKKKIGRASWRERVFWWV